MFLKGNNHPSLTERLSFTAAVALGKWHTPYYATRLKVLGGQAFTYQDMTFTRNENYYLGAHYDFMFDVVMCTEVIVLVRIRAIIRIIGVLAELVL